METKDVLNILFILGLIIITSCVVFVTYYFIQALKSITKLTDDLGETAQSLKNKVQLKALAAIPAILVSLVSRIIQKKRG